MDGQVDISMGWMVHSQTVRLVDLSTYLSVYPSTYQIIDGLSDHRPVNLSSHQPVYLSTC